MPCKIIKYLVLLFLFSCTPQSEETRFDNERHKIMHSVLREFVKTMQDRGLDAAGIGEGIDHSNGKQNYLQVAFNIETLPNVDIARPILVETVREFLNSINLKEGIKDYLAEYPFPLRFVTISIVNRYPEKGLFAVMTTDDDLIYLIDNPENSMGPPLEIHRESFSDAVRILAQQEIKDSKTYVMQNH